MKNLKGLYKDYEGTAARAIEMCGEWLLTVLPKAVPMALTVFMGSVIALQIGIHHGRALEREDIAFETAALGASITSLEAEVKRLKTEKTLAGIIECESRGRHEGNWGDGGKSYGILQFKKATFIEFAGKMGFAGADWMNKEHQYRVAFWMVSNGYGPRWSCYREAANG